MLKENWRSISRIERVGDLGISFGAFLLAYYGRDFLFSINAQLGLGLPFSGTTLAPLKDYFIVFLVSLVSMASFLNVRGAYGSMRRSSLWQLIRTFMGCALVVFFSLAATLFLFKIDVSRSFIGLYCVLLFMLLVCERLVVLRILRMLRKRGFNFRNVVICGVGPQALRLFHEIQARPELGIRVAAFARLDAPLVAAVPSDTFSKEKDEAEAEIIRITSLAIESKNLSYPELLTSTKQMIEVLSQRPVDEVLFTDFTSVLPEVERVVHACAEQGIRTTLAADLFSLGMVKSGLSYFGDMPLIHFQTPPGDRWELGLKRLVDVFGAGFLLMLFSPLLVLAAILVKVTSRGPVFFVQKRVGLNGRLFPMYKFRSMYVGAEQQLAELMARNEMNGPVFKIKDDPRITPLGKILRRFSIDELPQLWNVFWGDMSLVGPRPPVPGEVSSYKRKYRRRLSMRPGLTCTWQVSGRNNIVDFDTWVNLDLEYIDNWSLGRDLWLLFRTIPAVVRGSGAS